MSVKEENEITIKITCSNDELIKDLKSKGFKEGRKFSLDDYYLIPNNLNINELSIREILSKSIIIRYIVDDVIAASKYSFFVFIRSCCKEKLNICKYSIHLSFRNCIL